MASIPWLSILIPTRNRSQLARLAVRSALDAVGDDAEVVVSDNNEAPSDLGAEDPRLRVLRPPRMLSMADNWEFALRAARGAWVLFLADKSRIVPGAGRHLRRLLDDARAPVYSHLRARFTQHIEGPLDDDTLWAAPGELSFTDLPPSLTEGSSRKALEALCTDLGYLHRLPMFYNALVHRRVIERAYARTDKICVGNSPDVGSGMTLAVCSDTYIETTMPLTIEQFPSTELTRWSNGMAYGKNTPLMRQFVADAGGKLFGEFDFPLTFSSAIFQTQMDFRKRWPDETRDIPEPWGTYAASNIHEIQARPPGERLAMYRKLLASTLLPRPRPEALARMGASAALLAFPGVGAAAKRIRDSVRPPPPPDPLPPTTTRSFPSLHAALAFFEERCARFGAPG